MTTPEPRVCIPITRLARARGLLEAVRDWKHERRQGSVEEIADEVLRLLDDRSAAGQETGE